MPNPGGPQRAALYIRVSTDDQAERGYSIPEQQRALIDYASREGHEVVDVIVDDGYSGAYTARPGLDRVVELAEAGKIDVVVAIKRNRFFRSRLHRLLMDEELKKLGVSLVALDDTGNRFGDAMNDEFADWYREEVADNTRKGKLEKARQGKVIGGTKIPYGFAMNEVSDAYLVNEVEMVVVRRVFGAVADSANLYAVQQALMAEGVPAPAGGKSWSRTTLQNIVLNDCYFPFTCEKVAALVTPEVAPRLEPDKNYGI